MDKELRSILKKMGFADDSRGIINRYIKGDGAWDEHLNNSRNFILDCIKDRNYTNVAVYGSGWLLDLPLEELSGLCEHVWLYDLVHPSQVLHKIKKYKNVTAVTTDLTGGVLKEVYELVRSHPEQSHAERSHAERSRSIFGPEYPSTPLRVTQANPLRVTQVPDFAISLNLLSQIGDLVTGYLKRHMPVSGAEADSLIMALQKSHLELLMKQPSCLITDVTETMYDEHDISCGTKQLIKCSLPGGIKSRTWQWNFDPLGEYNPGFKTRSQVIALEL